MLIQPPTTQTPTPGQIAHLPGIANENQNFLPEAEISLLDTCAFSKGLTKRSSWLVGSAMKDLVKMTARDHAIAGLSIDQASNKLFIHA